jgi:hypothetical protein
MAHWPQHKNACKAKQKLPVRATHLKETDHVCVDLGADLAVSRGTLHEKFKKWRQASTFRIDYSFSDLI